MEDGDYWRGRLEAREEEAEDSFIRAIASRRAEYARVGYISELSGEHRVITIRFACPDDPLMIEKLRLGQAVFVMRGGEGL